MIKVMVIHSDIKMQHLLETLLHSDPNLEVVLLSSRETAIKMAEELVPDVIAMGSDLSGVDTTILTKEIMNKIPTPIILIHEAAKENKDEWTKKALEAGALAVVECPKIHNESEISHFAGSLLWNVRTLGKVKLGGRLSASISDRKVLASDPQHSQTEINRRKLIAIGASTGGPQAIQTILTELGPDFTTPILLVQHIGEGFTNGFIKWLSGSSSLRIKLAEAGEFISSKTVYIAPENVHLGITKEMSIEISHAAPIANFRPSISHLFQSVAKTCGNEATGILLSGMGEDGVSGLRAIKQCGGSIVIQDESSSAVFGMGSKAIQEGLEPLQLSPKGIASFLIESLTRGNQLLQANRRSKI